MQIKINLIKIALIFCLMQVCIVVLADNQVKLLNYVKDDLKSWISVNESVSREQIKLFITPERTFLAVPPN